MMSNNRRVKNNGNKRTFSYHFGYEHGDDAEFASMNDKLIPHYEYILSMMTIKLFGHCIMNFKTLFIAYEF